MIAVGEEVMINVGVVVGTSDGSDVGLILFGLEDRKRVGSIDGYDDGLLEGMIDGIVVDVVVGDTVTIAVGLAVDILDSKLVGEFVALNNGGIDGFVEGLDVGDNDNVEDCILDGMELWIEVSNVVGIVDGVDDWEYVWDKDGFDVGSEVGEIKGNDDDDGNTLNDMVGKVLGNIENDVDGFKLGCGEWMVDGLKVGMPDSRSLGFDVGDATR